MKVIWHGTAAIETACSGGRILFDPFVPLRGADTQMPPETGVPSSLVPQITFWPFMLTVVAIA